MTEFEQPENIYSVDGATPAEDLFVQIFFEVFGLDKIQYLVNEYPCQDIYGNYRYIDYALKTDHEKFAIEVDGEQVHNPALVSIDKYQDDLLKRNSLNLHGLEGIYMDIPAAG